MLFLIFVAAVTLEDKEDFCYIMAVKHIRSRTEELESFISTSKALELPSLRSKLLEDTFNTCVDEPKLDYYSEDLVLRSFDKYRDLVQVPLEKYKSLQDVKVSPDFSKRKPDIMKRAMMRPRSFKEL